MERLPRDGSGVGLPRPECNLIAAIEDAVGGELSTEEVWASNLSWDVIKVCRAHGLELTLGYCLAIGTHISFG